MRKLVISFPKSGRTWLRYGLHLAGYDSIIFEHDGLEYNDGTKPPLNFDSAKRRAHYASVDRIIYIERGTHDTIVSLFHQITGRFNDFFGYQGTISEFLRDPYFGVENLIRFQLMWRELASDLPVLTIRYEDMSENYAEVLQKTSAHFELGLSGEICKQIATKTTFAAMKKVEMECSFDQPWLQPRMGAPKIRLGRVGGYREALSTDDIDFVDAKMAQLGIKKQF
jgi:hypothetical protein